MDIATLLPIFHITDSVVARKADEFVRRSRIRVKSLGEAEICRNVVCLHLASLACNMADFPEQLALKYSGTSEKTYRKAFQVLRDSLEVQSVRLEQLVIQFGCMSLLGFVKEVLNCYQSRQCDNGQQNRPARNPTAAVIAAALLLCMKRRRISLDLKELTKKCQITTRALTQACSLVEQFCGDVLGVVPESPKKRPASSKKRSKQVQSDAISRQNDMENVPETDALTVKADRKTSKRRKADSPPREEQRNITAADPSLSYLFSGSIL